MLRLFNRPALCRLLQTVKILHQSMVLVSLSEVQSCLLVTIHQVKLTTPVHQKLTHLQLTLPCRVKQTSLAVLVQMIHIDPILQQQLCYL